MLCSKESAPTQKRVTYDTGTSSALPSKCPQARLSAVQGGDRPLAGPPPLPNSAAGPEPGGQTVLLVGTLVMGGLHDLPQSVTEPVRIRSPRVLTRRPFPPMEPLW